MELLSLFRFDFLIRALGAGLILSLIAPVIGMFLVMRRYSLLADALAHVSLLGVALALLAKIPVFIGALGTSLLAAFSMEKLRTGGKVFGEAVIALFLSGSLALSIVIIGATNGLNVNLLSYLFGSITTVTANDVRILSVLGAATVLFLLAFSRKLFLFALDEDLARVSGVNVRLVNVLFIGLAAVTVAAAMQMVGALLVGALMVIPVLAAMQFGKGFRSTLLLSIGISFCCMLGGFFLAFVYDLPSGGTVALFLAGTFLLVYAGRFLWEHLLRPRLDKSSDT